MTKGKVLAAGRRSIYRKLDADFDHIGRRTAIVRRGDLLGAIPELFVGSATHEFVQNDLHRTHPQSFTANARVPLPTLDRLDRVDDDAVVTQLPNDDAVLNVKVYCLLPFQGIYGVDWEMTRLGFSFGLFSAFSPKPSMLTRPSSC